MIEYLIIALHGLSISLKVIVAYAGCRLVWENFELYRALRSQSFETLVKMALWISIPTLVAGELLSRATNLYYYLRGDEFFRTPLSTAIILTYLSLTISGLTAALLYINVTAYGKSQGLRCWVRMLGAALAVGVIASIASSWRN